MSARTNASRSRRFFLTVAWRRMRDSSEEACFYACQRIHENNKTSRLQDERGRPNFNVRFYAVNKAGAFGGAEIHRSNGQMAVADSDGARLVDLAYLFE